MNVLAMAREGLRAELGAAVRSAAASGVRVSVRRLRIGAGDRDGYANFTVDPVTEPEALRGCSSWPSRKRLRPAQKQRRPGADPVPPRIW
jgi:hypothetical protein